MTHPIGFNQTIPTQSGRTTPFGSDRTTPIESGRITPLGSDQTTPSLGSHSQRNRLSPYISKIITDPSFQHSTGSALNSPNTPPSLNDRELQSLQRSATPFRMSPALLWRYKEPSIYDCFFDDDGEDVFTGSMDDNRSSPLMDCAKQRLKSLFIKDNPLSGKGNSLFGEENTK